MPAPVSMCLIVRDEPLLEQALSCVRPFVEEVVVVVTSVTDTASVETAKRFGAVVEVFEACNGPEGTIQDFSLARARSFELATKPWICWMDADDTISGIERLAEVVQWAEMLRQGRDVCVSFPYEYAYNDRGEVTCYQTRERLLLSSRNAFRWIGRVHEVLLPVSGFVLNDERIVWKHQRHKSTGPKEGGRNLRILREMYAENPGDARTLYYFGSALADSGIRDEAIEKLAEYIDKSGWDDEKYMACLKLVDLCTAMGQLEKAVVWGLRSLAICETWGEGYFYLCRAFFLIAQRGGGDQRRNWERCAHFGTIGLSKPPTKTPLFIDPTIRRYEIHVWLNFARSNIGDVRGALESVRAGLEARSDDTNLAFNKLIYEEFLAKADAIEALHRLKGAASELRGRFKHVRAPDEAYDAIEKALENPQVIIDSVKPPELTKLNGVSHHVEPIRSGKLDIVLACGDCWEEWSPATVAENGIGGSETAVIEMSKRFAARGHRVRVYTSTQGGVFDDVEWRRSAELSTVGKCDVLIAWRNAPLLELPIEARLRWLWVHDVFAVSATLENIARADRVLALSEWHKGYMLEYHAPCGLTADKVWVTRNGIDLARFDQQVARDPHKCVYSSSADRGLESLLQMWPRIRAAVPGASLSVMYGFANWEKMAAQRGDRESLRRIDRIKGALDVLKSAGVTYRGRVNQAELAREYLSAGVWTYPTWWSETSCIGAMEAQMAGLILITSPIAALKETVGPRGVMIEGDWMAADYQNRFVAATIGALTGEGPQVERARQAVQRYAREHFSWDGVCDSWERELLGLPAAAAVVAPVVDPAAYEGVL
jgi:glycosyltransferase involved in cell wall biosynthesis